MRLAHIHLPGLTRYTHASHLQEALIQRHFLYKDALRSARANTTASLPIPQPDPTIVTFTCYPTYTVGRRYLSAPSPSSSESKHTYHISPTQQSFLRSNKLAAFHSTSRGGDLTFHGPGQLTAYPLLDLRHHHITPRDYISLLETTVQRTCSRLSVPNTTTTSNPGVWMRGGERKICAVGVQVRRGVTGHGIALNVRDQEMERGSGYDTDKSEGGDEGGMLSWGFGRIIACGLEGKSVTWLTKEGARDDLKVTDVACVFVEEFADGLGGIDEIYNITEEEIMRDGLRRKIADEHEEE
jgi:lipoyl(octanoyl) transferase 2